MDIAIIGAGAAAVSLLDALSLTSAPPGGITVFEESPAWWSGRAYQPDADSVRVNAPPRLMSVRASDPQHYARWLADHGGADHLDRLLGVPIVPRAHYRGYLAASADDAIERLRSRGWRVELVADRVTAWDASGQTVRTAGGVVRPADRLVLCAGGGHPRDHYGLRGATGFVLEPYPLARTLADLSPEASVAVIGSGLTAVDIAVTLAAQGHSGQITLLSRRGLLPAVQQTPMPLTFRHLSPERMPGTVGGLVAAMEAELAEHGQDLAALAAEFTVEEDPVVRLRRHLSEVDSPHLGRRLFAVGAHLLGSAAWRRLPATERAWLRDEALRTINSLASPMVPVNAGILLRLFDSGRLRLVTGAMKIEPSDGKFRVHGPEEFAADVVVNAVNPTAHAAPQQSEALVASLVESKSATVGEDGGLEARDERIGILGAFDSGTSFVAPSVQTLAVAAEAMAARLVS
ncbi:FAD/NAD(P)-binding protein [Saccharomonospora xinjiangensis]|uniref:FAD/NAD(P)-binding protein n=1 Tax=Saccharomonospora xinjiangensis TaxID=75294 RepID=UPI00106F87BB|nr:FAD/NAD(P)-binding protein [Saccharomonospora xinjiangensis]QBQ60687.1 hypothetical protein EYD13_11670 [Saccharomonospora xinjiangensis]